MAPPSTSGGMVQMPEDDLEELLAVAASRGAKQALHDLGLHDDEAACDIRDLRILLAAFRSARSTFWQTTVRVLTTMFLAALMAGLAIKMKLFGGQ